MYTETVWMMLCFWARLRDAGGQSLRPPQFVYSSIAMPLFFDYTSRLEGLCGALSNCAEWSSLKFCSLQTTFVQNIMRFLCLNCHKQTQRHKHSRTGGMDRGTSQTVILANQTSWLEMELAWPLPKWQILKLVAHTQLHFIVVYSDQGFEQIPLGDRSMSHKWILTLPTLMHSTHSPSKMKRLTPLPPSSNPLSRHRPRLNRFSLHMYEKPRRCFGKQALVKN